MKHIAIVCKYLPEYRLAVFNMLSKYKEPYYEIIGDTEGREGIKTISEEFLRIPAESGGINWSYSKSVYYSKSLLLWETNILRKIFSKKYDLFVLDGAISHISTWILAMICMLAGKKVLFWSHGFKGVDKGLKKIIRTFFFKYLPDGLIIYGDFSKNIMVDAGFNPNKIFVIGNSLDFETQKRTKALLLKDKTFLEDLKTNLFAHNYPVLIFIGRLVSNKKVDKILDSISSLEEKGILLNCIIIGDGPEKSILEQKTQVQKLDKRVYFTNSLYKEEDIAKYFLIADLMVSPGNVGLNCIHSLSYGVPVITHDNFSSQNPEVEAINDNKNGLFFKYNDFNDMTAKIQLWFSTEHDAINDECLKPILSSYNPKKHAEKINNAVLSTLKL